MRVAYCVFCGELIAHRPQGWVHLYGTPNGPSPDHVAIPEKEVTQ